MTGASIPVMLEGRALQPPRCQVGADGWGVRTASPVQLELQHRALPGGAQGLKQRSLGGCSGRSNVEAAAVNERGLKKDFKEFVEL